MKKFLSLIALLCYCTTIFAQANQQWITAASGVKARATAATTGEEIARLPIGTLLKQIGDEKREATVGDKKDFWYHVALPSGKDGWVFGAFLLRFDEAKRGEIYLQIARTKMNAKETAFAEYADLTRFLSATFAGINDRATLAELELLRWQSLQKAFYNLPHDQSETTFLENDRYAKANKNFVIFSEPSGDWLVKADIFWELSKKYADLPIGETIAWEAAQQPLPGECEGDDICALSYYNLTEGKYLSLYPKGKFVSAALDKLIEGMGYINRDWQENFPQEKKPSLANIDKQIRKDALAGSAKLRASLAQVTSPKKAKLLQLIAQYEKNYAAPKK